MKRLMTLVEACAAKEGMILPQRTTNWSNIAPIDLYNCTKKCFEYEGGIQMKHWHKQLSWKTVLNHYVEKKAFANEIDQ
jgi:hypothetical protein